MTKLLHARIAYTSGGKTDELASGFSDINVEALEIRGSEISLECEIISI